MFDPRHADRLKAEVFDEHAPAPLGNAISPAMRSALIALLAGPAEFLVRNHRPQHPWKAKGGIWIKLSTIRALADRGLAAVADHPRKLQRTAALTPKGIWYAHRAAGEAADQLIAAARAEEKACRRANSKET